MKLLRYTVVMFTFPIGVFYIFFYLVFGGDPDMLGWSGLAAVLAANLVIFAYVKMAFNEDKDDRKDNSVDNVDKDKNNTNLQQQDELKRD